MNSTPIISIENKKLCFDGKPSWRTDLTGLNLSHVDLRGVALGDANFQDRSCEPPKPGLLSSLMGKVVGEYSGIGSLMSSRPDTILNGAIVDPEILPKLSEDQVSVTYVEIDNPVRPGVITRLMLMSTIMSSSLPQEIIDLVGRSLTDLYVGFNDSILEAKQRMTSSDFIAKELKCTFDIARDDNFWKEKSHYSLFSKPGTVTKICNTEKLNESHFSKWKKNKLAVNRPAKGTRDPITSRFYSSIANNSVQRFHADHLPPKDNSTKKF